VAILSTSERQGMDMLNRVEQYVAVQFSHHDVQTLTDVLDECWRAKQRISVLAAMRQVRQVSKPVKCDFCSGKAKVTGVFAGHNRNRLAVVDGPTVYGPLAFMCLSHLMLVGYPG